MDTIINIPVQLQNKDFRFLKIKHKEKLPVENKWQDHGYAYNDSNLINHIINGGNYGIIGGYGRVILLDIDQGELGKQIQLLLNTFTVKSGKGGFHFYLLSDYDKNHVLGGGKGELRANKQYVVAPNSIHPNGNKYEVVNDVPLLEISGEDLSKLLKPFFKFDKVDYAKVLLGELERGARNDGFFRTACLMRFQRIPKKDATVILKTANEKNEHPISEVELKRVLDNAYQYKGMKVEDKKEKSKDELIETSFYEDKNYLYEQVYTDGISKFARYNKITSEIDYVDDIENVFKPNSGEEIIKKAIMLPSKAEPYINDDTLDKEIIDFIYTWLDIPEDTQQFALWNIKRSWVYDKFHTLNYLRALGDTGQGKTRYLDTLGSLHYKPILTSGATTSAPIFRIIDKWKGSMIFDECDLKVTDETADIIKIINQGYEKGKHIMRCDQNDATKILFFDPFCPKILATRKPFTDKAVESRCITTVMIGTKRININFSLGKDFYDKSQELRNKLLTWRFHNYSLIDSSKQINDIDFTKLEPRVQQIVSSYIAMFGNNKEQMIKFKEFIREYQEDLIQERANSWEGSIVKSIYELYHEEDNLNISNEDIINHGGFTNDKGEKLKPRVLSNSLKALGFGKTIVRKVGIKTKRCIPLDAEHLENVFKRYGYAVTKVTMVTGTPEIKNNDEIGQKTLENPESYGTPPLPISTVTPVTSVTRFNPKTLIHNPCCYPKGYDGCCGKTPCNDLEGINYCQEHFEVIQEQNNLKEKIID